MGELTVEQIIKLVLGALVIVAVIIGLYFAFKDKIMDFFNGISPGVPGFWRAVYEGIRTR